MAHCPSGSSSGLQVGRGDELGFSVGDVELVGVGLGFAGLPDVVGLPDALPLGAPGLDFVDDADALLLLDFDPGFELLDVLPSRAFFAAGGAAGLAGGMTPLPASFGRLPEVLPRGSR